MMERVRVKGGLYRGWKEKVKDLQKPKKKKTNKPEIVIIIYKVNMVYENYF